jgi:two-component system, cell cycle response regulator DivK
MSISRILLVEDNIDNLELVRFLLIRSGYQVLDANDGQMGMDIARRELPDLILMDLSLPGVDGWTAARELKADPKTASIPLLALTAHTLPGDRSKALESGFNGYISKPINLQSFADDIARALNPVNSTTP